MATLNIKALSAGISLFALCMVGTVSAKTNTHEGEKKEKEVKVETAKALVNETWYFTGGSNDNPELATNYSLSSSGLPNCGAINREVICQIEAPDDGTGKPNMSASVDGTTVQQQIHDAQESLEDGTPTENTTVKGFRPE